jgi:hypothetical protein
VNRPWQGSNEPVGSHITNHHRRALRCAPGFCRGQEEVVEEVQAFDGTEERQTIKGQFKISGDYQQAEVQAETQTSSQTAPQAKIEAGRQAPAQTRQTANQAQRQDRANEDPTPTKATIRAKT